ncbi:MAG: hypothetical protein HY318_12790 [Armatimonadetes bacterium]|nr:hypothetical protein [Armatimonadota bacterium]
MCNPYASDPNSHLFRIREQRRRPARGEEDNGVVFGDESFRDVVYQSGHGFGGVDRIKKDSFTPGDYTREG